MPCNSVWWLLLGEKRPSNTFLQWLLQYIQQTKINWLILQSKVKV